MNRATKERLHRISAFVMALALIMTTIVPYSYLSGIFAITAKAEEATSAKFYDEETIEATWDTADVSATIQNKEGGVTNDEGDVLWVDASASGAKFAPNSSNNYVQVNQNTKITIPTRGNKVTVTLTIYSSTSYVNTVEDFLESYWNIFGETLKKANVISISNNTDTKYKDVKIECYMAGGDSEITFVELKAQSYIRTVAVTCENLPTVTISGTITSTVELPSGGIQVAATNETTGTYSSDVTIAEDSMSGTYSIAVPAESTAMNYEISISDNGYIIYEGNTTHSVSADSASPVTADLKLMKVDTVFVSGSISGLDDVVLDDDFNVSFTTTSETEYEPVITVDKTNKTYTATIEKNVEYTVGLTGVNDYEVTSPSGTVSCTDDGTLNITAAKQALYNVSLTLTDGPDLAGKSIEYIYTNTSDNYVYKFTDTTDIALRKGTYNLTLGGEFEQFPYDINSGAEVTVTGEGTVAQTVNLKEVKSWTFYAVSSGDYYKDTIASGATGYYKGLVIDAVSGSFMPNGSVTSSNSTQFVTGSTITIPVSGACTVSIEAYKLEYALYTISGSDNSSKTVDAAASDSTTASYKYESKEAGTVVITSTGTAYIKSISVVYAAKEVEYKTQPEMPKVYEYGTSDKLVVQPVGQVLEITQSGGVMKTADSTGPTLNDSISYYGFDATDEFYKLTADVTVTGGGTDSYSGVFFGAFNGQYVATISLRAQTKLRAIYSKKSDAAGAGGFTETVINEKQTVTFTAERTSKGFVITVTPKGGVAKSQTYTYGKEDYLLFKDDSAESFTEISYGFVFANVEATVKNMKYYYYDSSLAEVEGADPYVLKYDQNDCYYADGTAPIVSTVTAEAASTRDYITVDWTASTPASGDGMYVLQVSTDNGAEWTDVATDLTETTYKYGISAAGSYLFRVCGKLGVNGTDYTAYAVSDTVSVIAALDSPVVSISSTVSSIDLSWAEVENADRYEVYRYSYDDTAENAKMIKEVKETSYKDEAVTAEMPYYYYVIAYSNDNESNPSETVWAVPSAGHTGEYVYEDDAAGITITKKSYDTVYNGKITLEGVVEKAGTVALIVNGKTYTQKVNIRGTFAFDDIDIEEGRNDVNIEVTDTDGNVTRQTFNFVYLTNYDKVVDAAFTGTDGEEVNGIPTYKTVQEAVNSVATDNAERVVILVKAGDYEEHLTVSTPNITLIGEDSTKTRIFYDSKNVERANSTIGQVGGDMAQRCAVYVMSGATGFSAENLTFENTYEYLGDGTISNESCDALRNDANNASYVNVRLLGYQDTLCANKGTQYYYKCYIAGNVDFIYGNEPRALFNDCQIVFRYNANKNRGYICAPRGLTDATYTYGLTFYNCQVLSEDGCSGNKYYLARPWDTNAYVTWIDCYMGKIIKENVASPYADWSSNDGSAAKSRFFEYGSYGPGYAINANRRQISKNMADKMITSEYLTWDPYTAVSNIGKAYVGDVTTDATDSVIDTEYDTDSYATIDGDDTGLSKYSIEGYAQAANVTGGGTLKETSENYYKAATAEDFLDALIKIKKSGKASVIELTGDIALGSKEVDNFASYSDIIKAHNYQALTHPTLIKTGVSMLMLDGMSNLTIYSKNGAKITHVCTDITGSSNIIIRNITFDELWEWDDEYNTNDKAYGTYDRNDWDYMTIEKGSHDIWIDHCTFYKAYDGVIDIKTPTELSNITISWCSFQPASAGQTSPTDGGTFFETMMQAMEANPSAYEYYSHLLDLGMSAEQIRGYAYGQKKTHLLGQSDKDTTALNITATFANNWYNNSMDRMPRLRFGTAHVYNCIMDAQVLRKIKLGIAASADKDLAALATKIVSNGTSSNMGAHLLLENCYISGIENAIISGNGDSARGYINAINSVYYLDGEEQELKPVNNSSNENYKDLDPLVQDADEFKSALPYSNYTLYDANELYTEVQPYTGAGVLDLTTLQWEKTVYHEWELVEDGGKEATCVKDGEKVYRCTVCGIEKTEVIPATGEHVYTDWTVDEEATTEKVGEQSRTCVNCGNKEVQEIPKLEDSGDNSGNNGDDNTEETPSNPSDSTGETPSNPSDNTGETPSNPSDNTGETPSNPSDSTGETPSNPSDNTGETPSNPSDNTGETPSNPSDTTGETPSNPSDNNTDDTTGETPSNPSDNTGDNSGDNNTDDTTGETPSNPSDNTDNTTGNTPSETPTQPEVEISDSEAGVAEIIVSKVTEDVPQAGFTESKSELLNKLLTAEEKIEVKAGANVKVSMKVETVKADDKPVESVAIKTAVEALTEQNTIGIYLDITLEKNVGNGVPVQVKETVGGKLSISVEVPAEMINTDSTKTRKYSVARYHDGVVDILDCNFADGKITFESDKFSVYAIIYSDSDITTSDKNDNNTQAATEASNEATTAAQQTGETPTGDSLSLAYVLGLFVLLMMSAVTLAVLLRKKES